MNTTNEQMPAEAKKTDKTEDMFETYLLLGDPRSGKTTYFCSMAEHLQELATSSNRFHFMFCDPHTSRFIKEQMKRLRNDDWPDKTFIKAKKDYHFQMVYKKRFFGIHFYTEIVDFSYHDYPGEVFEDVFSDSPSGRYENDAKDLQERIALAKGIFLMLDIKEIFNEENVDASQEALVAMIQYLRKQKNPPKLALIFNKIELIPNYSHDVYMRKFKRLYGNAYQWLQGMEHKFFSVYTLGGECRINPEGKIIPPKELHPRLILKPVNWMIHFI